MRHTHWRRGGILVLLFMGFYPAPSRADCQNPDDPDCVRLLQDFTGTVGFFATGASFTLNDDADDRPDAVIETAEVTVAERRIPARAQLIQAYLYFGGSLYVDPEPTQIPDDTVEIQVPGSDAFVAVTGQQVYQSGAVPGFPEVRLYTVRADITDVIQNAGGQMTGTYRVQGFDADIFSEGFEHTAANASFSIVLVFEEARLPPRNIVLFDGLQEVLGSTITLSLDGFIVSEQPSGSLTLYAQEGDCHPGPADCAQGNNLAGTERVRVVGADPNRTLILQDNFNPSNDIFNRTINTVDPPQTNVTGTDIDTFDISDVLAPGDERVTVEITTPEPNDGRAGELVGLAYVVVGIDVFAPELRLDSRIEVRSTEGERRPSYAAGESVRVTYALSNTGNLPGTQVNLTADLPAEVTSFTVLEAPEGTTPRVDERGGAFGTGRIEIDGASIRHGEANDLVLQVQTACPLDAAQIMTLTASVGAPAEGGVPFQMTTTATLTARDLCGPRFFLYGGGGCRHTSAPRDTALGWAILFLGWLGLLHRRRRWAVLGLVLWIGACGSDPVTADRPPPEPIGTPCPEQPQMVVIDAGGLDPFCMDAYEAGLDGPRAVSNRFTLPAGNLTWAAAQQACDEAGKRLCTATEWQVACRGERQLTYPYGDTYEPLTCNGFDAARRGIVESGAMIRSQAQDGRLVAGGCVSSYGVYDLSGNLWEWNATSYLGGRRRGLAGGSFQSNRTGLTCRTEDRHAEPEETQLGYGFRCCVDLPTGS